MHILLHILHFCTLQTWANQMLALLSTSNALKKQLVAKERSELQSELYKERYY